MILKNCSACVIYGPDENFQIKARVNHGDDRITLHFDDQNELGMNTDRLRIDFFDSQLGYLKTISYIEISKNTDPYILEPWKATCEILEVTETLQRQKELRVRVRKEITFHSSSQDSFEGTIENISAGGLYLITSTQLAVGEIFNFDYCFFKKEQNINAKILRGQQLPKKRFGWKMSV